MFKGLKYYSLLEPSGYGLAALGYLKALINSGLPLQWCPLIWHQNAYTPWTKVTHPEQAVTQLLQLVESDQSHREALFEALSPLPQVSHVLLHTVPEYWPNLIEKRYVNIGYTVWETNRLPKHFPALLEQLDQLLVPSRFSLAALLRSKVYTPTKIIPHILNINSSIELQSNSAGRLESDILPPEWSSKYVFYSINEWNARKAIWTLLRVFLSTFSAHDKVALVLKTSAQGPTSEADGTLHDTHRLLAQTLK